MTKRITLLGVDGCPTCARLDAQVQQAITEAQVAVTVEKVTEAEQIMGYNAGGLPAVLIDDQVKAVRRVPSVEELIAWLQEK